MSLIGPPTGAALLLKLIGRIHKLNAGYMGAALKGTGLKQIEEFGILLTIQQDDRRSLGG
jgi:hypothetical protein